MRAAAETPPAPSRLGRDAPLVIELRWTLGRMLATGDQV
jgi:hypothetical protein